MPVGVLLKNIDSRELSEWIAMAQIDEAERKEAELAAKATTAEAKLRGKRKNRGHC